MNRTLSLLLVVASVCLFSCQKEFEFFEDAGSGGAGGGGGNSNGDLLVKVLQITPATKDTNILTFQWDANKRLAAYISSGKVNSIATDIRYYITRVADGKIKRIVSKSNFSVFLDSVVYDVHYNGSRLLYAIDTQFNAFFDLRDSIAFTYNAAGYVGIKEVYTDIFGSVELSSKEEYLYDANGNLTKISTYASDGLGGFDLVATATYTFDGHKNAVVLGDESYLVLGAVNISKNNPLKQVQDDAAGGLSYTGVFTVLKFNSFDRPVQSTLTVTPQPPGSTMKLEYFYQ